MKRIDLSAAHEAAKKHLENKEKAVAGDISAPHIIKGIGDHLPTAAKFFGRQSLKDVIGGVGSEETNEYRAPINLGSKSALGMCPPEIAHVLLDAKKHIHNAQTQARILATKTGMAVGIESVPYFKSHLEPFLKAFNLTDFSAWLATTESRFYFEELQLDPGLEGFFQTEQMKSKTVSINGASGRLMGRRESDTATYTAQSNSAAEFNLTAEDLVCHTDLTDDLINDSTPDVFENARKEVALGVRRAFENAILNGDTTATHMDSDTTDAQDFRKWIMGLRKRALANSANGSVYNHGGAGTNLSMIQGILKLLGINAKDKTDLLWILPPTISNNICFGKVPEILTVQNFGQNATIITGTLPPIFGIQTYESEWCREDLDANAVYAAAAVLTALMVVKKSRFRVGQRAPMKIWATPSLANSDKILMTAKRRVAFGGVAQSDKEKSVVLGRNIALT